MPPLQTERSLTAESWLTTGKVLTSLTLGPPPSQAIHQSRAPKAGCWAVTLWGKGASKQRQWWEGGVWGKGEREESRIKTRRKLNPAVFLSVWQQGFNNLTEQAALFPHQGEIETPKNDMLVQNTLTGVKRKQNYLLTTQKSWPERANAPFILNVTTIYSFVIRSESLQTSLKNRSVLWVVELGETLQQ